MATRQEVRAAVEELRRFHKLGIAILKEYGRRAAASNDETSVMDEIRDRYELKAHHVRAVRRFADPKRGYSKPELDELCKLCLSKDDNPSSLVVGLTLVRHLLTIKDKPARRRFQAEMIKHGWTHTRTEAELTRRFGFRRHRSGGRRPYIPDDVDAAILQINDMVTAWRRWFDRLSEDRALESKEVRLSDLAPELQSALGKVDRALKLLDVTVKNVGRSNQSR